jgi:formate hydrogenlyase subunit 6/NADH:ubiquinone oxidoreductase subunit I
MNKTATMLPLALKSLVKKPATIAYPRQRADFPADFRGRLVFDPAKCVGCKLCMKDCPSGAIEIERDAAGGLRAVLQMGHCLYCGQCVDSCRKQALRMTPEFELAVFDRGKLTVGI